MAATRLIRNANKNTVVEVLFNKYCSDKIQGLKVEELQHLYETIRPDSLSLKQIEASLRTVCESMQCDREDVIDVMREMDRRYFLANDLKWEFALLDRERKGAISEQDARFLFKMVHGDFFSPRRWSKFLKSRAAKDSLISFSEIEVDLCDIPTMGWIEEIIEEEEEERKGLIAFPLDNNLHKFDAFKTSFDLCKGLWIIFLHVISILLLFTAREIEREKEEEARRKAKEKILQEGNTWKTFSKYSL